MLRGQEGEHTEKREKRREGGRERETRGGRNQRRETMFPMRSLDPFSWCAFPSF
jgi:hypothetical protein